MPTRPPLAPALLRAMALALAAVLVLAVAPGLRPGSRAGLPGGWNPLGTAAAQGGQAPAYPSTIDGARTGSLSIHKSAGDPLKQFGDPTNPIAERGLRPMLGIAFTIRKVDDVDLRTNSGWEKLAKTRIADYYVGGSRAGSLGAPLVASTNAEGTATFPNLPVGAYYVEEDHASAQKAAASVVTPFIVTIPQTDHRDGAAPDSWIYDVEVFAKDQHLDVNKSASRTCANAKDRFDYGVSAALSAPDAADSIKRMELADPLPDQVRLVEGSSKVYLTSGRDKGVKQELAEGTDYTVRTAPGNVASVVLTASGLKKAAKERRGRPDAAITWTFTVEVLSGTDKQPGGQQTGVDSADNRAYLLVDGYPEFTTTETPGVPSNKVRVKIGGCSPTAPVTPIPIPVQNPDLPGGGPGSPVGESGGPGGDGGISPGGETAANPDQPGANGTQTDAGRFGGLAMTGANILILVLVGAGLIGVGVLLTRRNKRNQEE
ncbi:SpaH/EbpB family LPXTG-anchored major pilin [Corynebacterium heidelbergense]|uniref:SpaH/EbpB family LPXTG-anchored major pilin n=2 Tax=Corynebacterium heidelbergense TaxID=2055947 RepID=UPI00235855F2|nr:SpaH/EbpB family LPXTG-anchored major pilin [Corynebacterium heidelbergense]